MTQPFGYSDLSDQNGKPLPPINTETNGAGSIAPGITTTVLVYLGTERGFYITDEAGRQISLEGLSYGN